MKTFLPSSRPRSQLIERSQVIREALQQHRFAIISEEITSLRSKRARAYTCTTRTSDMTYLRITVRQAVYMGQNGIKE